MNRCETVRDEVKALLDGELPPARALRARLHVRGCPECRMEMKAMEQVAETLRSAEPDGLDPALRERLLSSAPSAENPESLAPVPWWRLRALQMWAGASAVVILWFLCFPLFDRASQSAQSESKGRSMASEEMTLFGHLAAGARGADVESPPSQRAMAGAPRSSQATGAVGLVHDYDEALPDRKVARTASVTLSVERVEERSAAIERMVRDSGGFVARNDLSTGDGGLKSASLEVRVPSGGFDSFLREVAKLGEVRANSVTGEDITETIGDDEQAEQVLRNDLREARERLRNPGRIKNSWLDSETQRQLKIRIAQVRARLEARRKLAALGVITIRLEERPKTAVKTAGFYSELSDTGQAAVSSFLRAARLPVLLLIWVAAYSPVWIPLAVAYRFAAAAHRRRVAARETREWQARRAEAPNLLCSPGEPQAG